MVGSNLQNGPLLNVYHQDISDMCPHVFIGRDLNILHINSGHVGAYGRDVFSFRLVMISARFLGLYVSASATRSLSCSCRFLSHVVTTSGPLGRYYSPCMSHVRLGSGDQDLKCNSSKRLSGQLLQMRLPDDTGRAIEADPTEIDPPKSASF